MSIALRQPCPKCGAVALESHAAGEMYAGSLPVAVCNNTDCRAAFLSVELIAILVKELESRTMKRPSTILKTVKCACGQGITYDLPVTTLVICRACSRVAASPDHYCCTWPGCDSPALCTSGNFDWQLVCNEHFKITNGQMELDKASLTNELAEANRSNDQFKAEYERVANDCAIIDDARRVALRDLERCQIDSEIHVNSLRRRGDLLAAANRKLGEELEVAKGVLRVKQSLSDDIRKPHQSVMKQAEKEKEIAVENARAEMREECAQAADDMADAWGAGQVGRCYRAVAIKIRSLA